MKHFATITLTLFLLICVIFVECRNGEERSLTEDRRQRMKSETSLTDGPTNPLVEVGGEAYLLTTDDREIVFKYNRNTNQWELVALFH